MNQWTKRIGLFVSLVALLVVFAVIVNLQARQNFGVPTAQKAAETPRSDVAPTATRPLVVSDSPLPTPLPTTEFSITPVPTSPITIDDYKFGTPEEVMVGIDFPLVAGWLPDSQTALVVDNDTKAKVNSYTLFQTLNIKTQERRTFATTGPLNPQLVWLQSSQKVAVLGNEDSMFSVFFTDLKGSSSIVTAKGKVRAIAGRDNRLFVINWDDPFPQLFDDLGNQQEMPTVNLYNYGLNSHEPPNFAYFLALSWHPTDSKVAISDKGGFIILDVRSGQVNAFKLGEGRWAPVIEWSPDGNTIALNLGEGLPPFDETSLAILDLQSGKVTRIPTPLKFISDMTWSPNGRQILVGGTEVQPGTNSIYLVDSVTQQISRVEQASQRFIYAYSNMGVKWSPDGRQILFRCQIPGVEKGGLCKMDVEIAGGIQ